MTYDGWTGFKKGDWVKEVNVRDFIQRNYKPYTGNENFLAPPTGRTLGILAKYTRLNKQEKENGGVLDIDTDRVSSLLTYPAGYIDKDNELIVGLQTDAPLKRGVNPFGGIRMAETACDAYGYTMGENIREYFRYRTTHNDGVFRVYTPEMKKARHTGVITGLPDAYGRGRIIGDYRRVALYGTNYLIKKKKEDMAALGALHMDESNIRLREEVYRQIDFLEQLKKMGGLYGYDIGEPAKNFREAVQWIYFAYLGAIKEQNGAAMSLGRVSTFLDIYAERELKAGETETEIQEVIDDFVIKLRMARQLRTPEYDELFAGDPTWVTESIGGTGIDGRTLVTRTSFRFLHTLYGLKPAPEPNLTVLWSEELPEKFKRYCAKVSIDTCAIQYENDDIMRPIFGDDYGIACCVSAMTIGKQTQLFGARCNLPKVLLLAINGGRDEMSGEQIAPESPVLSGPLDYAAVYKSFIKYIDWLAALYVNTMNVIHYMHDKYAYEKLEMALHDTDAERLMAFGAAGISVVADSLSAIKYARVTAVPDGRGVITSFEVDGDFPKYGNDDDRVDGIAAEIAEYFSQALARTPAYRGAKHTLSLLTITSNVVYGSKTGATPDGRKSGEPFAPGANPQHNRETSGALASLNSVAKIPYDCCRDGISNTFSITPESLGARQSERCDNLVDILNGYFARGAHHLNVNVISRDRLIAAREKPEDFPNLTIRVSGYAVRFNSLKKKSQDEVLARTFH
ncbi:MAG: formate C-acetyltransferase [Clostridiales bacterium]|jgi:formate C-acetyltransferase|nr:formate C-acetyltransferase [Clostridiales bacterium]